VGALTSSIANSAKIALACDFPSHEGAHGIGIHPARDAHSQVGLRSVLRQGAQRGTCMAGSSAISRGKRPELERLEESIRSEEAGAELAWLERLPDVAVFLGYRGRRVDTPMGNATAQVAPGDLRSDSMTAGNSCTLFHELVYAGVGFACLNRGRHCFGVDPSGDMLPGDVTRARKP